MNKVKIFFFAAALTLVTAGVFASKAKFAIGGNLYASNTGILTSLTTYDIASSLSGVQFLTSGATKAQITSNASSTSYGLYYDNAGTLVQLYFQ